LFQTLSVGQPNCPNTSPPWKIWVRSVKIRKSLVAGLISRSSISNIAENLCTIPHYESALGSFRQNRSRHVPRSRTLGGTAEPPPKSRFVPHNPAACHPENQMPSATWIAFQRALTRWEKEKIQPATALRNTAGVVIPLAAATLLGQSSAGLVMAIGALNVAYSDGTDPYPIRARRMLLSSCFVSLAVLVGGLAGRMHAAAAVAAMLWAFGAGLIVVLGTTAADLGTISLVTLIVFAARPLSANQAALAALLALSGGFLQTLLSLVFCRAGRYQENRSVMAGVFGQLSHLARASTAPGSAPLATVEFTAARDVLRAQNRDHGPHAEMFGALLSQAERMRLALLTLTRLRRRLGRDGDAARAVRDLDEFREAAAQVTDAIRDQLKNGPTIRQDVLITAAETAAERVRDTGPQGLSSFSRAAARDALMLMDSITGQLRAALRMVHAKVLIEPSGTAPVPARVSLFHTRLATLRANLSFQSIAFRHAVRLASCIFVGEAISTSVDWQRSYWIPMTIAIVLKPDFLSTLSRGALRLAGTFAGLIVATAIYRCAPASAFTDLVVVGLFTLILRWWGPANYGLLSLAISAIVVGLIAGTGVAPRSVILLRGMNTSIGGVIAMLAYILWPTWERAHVGENLARLLDSYRAYVRGIRAPDEDELERVRQAARVARTNAIASADRLGAEPATSPRLVQIAAAMLASSHNFIYAAMAFESALPEKLCSATLDEFLNHVDLMLYFVAATLRGLNPDQHHVYDLREHYRALAASLAEDSLLQVEADRMTNALNTLRDEVLELRAATVKEGS
jgi:uncharacterized membrane protein YccC